MPKYLGKGVVRQERFDKFDKNDAPRVSDSMNVYAVIRSRGASWQPALPLEQQSDWEAHAVFMDALVSEGFVLLGGPLEGTADVLLVVRANSQEEIESRLQSDPWTTQGLLRISRIDPWTVRLGSLP